MVRLQELIEILSDQNMEDRAFAARASKTCKICGGSATSFKSRFTKMEYLISSICEKCQEYYYLNEDSDLADTLKRIS